MRNINRATYDTGERLPAFTVDQLPGKGANVLTISEAYEMNLRDSDTGGFRKQIKIVFCTAEGEAIPFAWWPNNGSTRILVRRLGTDLDTWEGKKAVIHAAETTNPKTGDKVIAVWATPADDWDRALADAGGEAVAKRPKRRR